MKRSFLYLTAVIVSFAMAFVACTPEISTLPMGVMLDPSSLTLAPGESLKLSAEVIPDEATIKSLIWSSDNAAVATVDDGVVTAITEGNALITVTTKSGQKMSTCLVKVAWPVDRVVLDNSTVILTVGKSQRLAAYVIPNDAPDISVKWESSNPGIVEVVDGVIVAKALGTATVTVTTVVGSRKASCTVRVIRDKHIFMTNSLSSMSMTFSVAGSGTIDINWGDNSEIETISISETPIYPYHYFSGTPPFTVTVEGENITDFRSFGNQLTYLSFSNMTDLTYINCASNGLTSLAVNGCIALEELTCHNNQLSSLDLSNNTALTFLDCSNNPITSLNVSNAKIKALNVSGFLSIEHLIVNNNKNLTELDCSKNRIMSLDLSGNTALTILNCSNNQLTNLNVANIIALKSLDCSLNQLTNLDATNNNVLESLDCSMNRFSTEALNDLFKTLHGNNVPGEKTVRILGNPGSITCNQSVATDKGWDVVIGNFITMTMNPQGGVVISFYGRGAVVIDWGDGSFESYTLQQGIWNWSNYYHYYHDDQSYTVTIAGDIDGFQVSHLVLKNLDVSNNPGLKTLNCPYTRLSSLDVSKNTMLEILTCADNQLTDLDVSNNVLLMHFDCSNNLLTNLDVSNLKALVTLNCVKNQFSAAGLNALFGTLHGNYVNGGYKWIYINNNPGSNDCDRTIAMFKGWIVN